MSRPADQISPQDGALPQHIADALPALVYVLDLEQGRIVYVNARTQSMLGRTPEEAKRMSVPGLRRLLHREDVAKLAEYGARFADVPDGEFIEDEHRLKHASGEWRWFQTRHAVLQRGRDGTPQQILGIAQDITRGKRAEARFSALLEAAPDAMVIVDRSGTVQLVNSQAERLFGYRRDELLGQPVEILLPERFRAVHGAHRGGYFSAPRPGPMGAGRDLWGRRKDGSEFPVEISLSPIEMEEGLFVSSAIRDITERRQMQQKAEQQGRLSAVGQLAAGIAHDFNNILAVVIGVVDGLRARPRIPAMVRERLDLVAEQGRRGRDLVRQIIDFGRQSLASDRQRVDLDTFSGEVIKLLERLLPENMAIIREIEPGGFEIMATPAQLQQILTNLVINARDAMPEGGPLRLKLARLSLRASDTPPVVGMKPGEWVTLAVSDTGTGMAPEVLERLFEPFFTTKPPGRGTGLGLAQVYGLVKQNGGFIDVVSALGQGTTFRLYFPAIAAPARLPPSAVRPAAPVGKGEWILVVEDDVVVRTVNVWLLKSQGYRPLAASDADEALDLYQRHRGEIALVLMDLTMSGTDVRLLYGRMREESPHLPVIICSGHARDDAARSRGLEGVADWLQKPIDPDQLAVAVHRALDRSKGVAPAATPPL